MRPLEIVLVLVLLLSSLQMLSPLRYRRIWISVAPIAAVVTTLCHVAGEGYRWQMFSAYALVGILILYRLLGWPPGIRASLLVGVAGLGMIGVAILLSTALPVFELPAPSGPYPVGTQSRYIVDKNDPLNATDRRRELMIQIWYPAGLSSNLKQAPYKVRGVTDLWNGRYSLAITNSYSDAQLSKAQDRYPVLLFEPSWWGQRTENTFLTEELASRGYIVIGIDHPYSSIVTAFPDGRVAKTALTVTEDYSTEAAYLRFLRATEEQISLRTQDAMFVLDALHGLNENDPQGLLNGRLDLDRVGILGFSFGGSVAAEACWRDRRFKAGVDLDGMVAGESAKNGTFAPFFFMLEDDSPVSNAQYAAVDTPAAREKAFDDEQYASMRRSVETYGAYWMIVQNTLHMDFSDSPFYSPLRTAIPGVSFDPTKRALILRKYTVAFFNKYLKGIREPLLDGPTNEFPEVRLEKVGPDRSELP